MGEAALRPRPTFHLLDVDPIYFVMKGGDGPSPRSDEVYGAHPRLKMLAGLMNARRLSAYSLGPDIFLLLDQSQPLWEPHVVRSARADDSGGALFEDVKAGDYWLMGIVRERGREAFWLRRVTVNGGTNEVVLEGHEALYFK